MSVRFDASTDKLSRTTNLPTITSFTMMGWFYLSADRAAYAGLLMIGQTGADVSYTVAADQSGTTQVLKTWNGSVEGSGVDLGLTTWHHIAMTVAGTGAGQFLTYVDGVLNITSAGNSAVTAQQMLVGSNYLVEWENGRAAAVKIWSGTTLTADEIKAEMRCYVPVRAANLNTWSPLLSAGDVGNYANTGAWTVGGTLTTEDGPPIAWSVAPVRGRRLAAPVAVAAVTPQQNIFVRTVAVPSAALV